MKLTKIYQTINERRSRDVFEDVDANSQSIANILMLFDKLQSNTQFSTLIDSIQMPTEKLKAILKFAEMLGIPESKFYSFVNNIKSVDEQ